MIHDGDSARCVAEAQCGWVGVPENVDDSRKLEALVDLHLAAFPGCFLTQLGKPFLRLLYAGFIHGCSAIYLTTDEADNDRVNRFYAKCGFVLRDTFKRPGKRVMIRWVME